MATIQATPDGPLKAQGVSVLDAQGNVIKQGAAFLCRCGRSANAPFCDGTHKLVGFRA